MSRTKIIYFSHQKKLNLKNLTELSHGLFFATELLGETTTSLSHVLQQKFRCRPHSTTEIIRSFSKKHPDGFVLSCATIQETASFSKDDAIQIWSSLLSFLKSPLGHRYSYSFSASCLLQPDIDMIFVLPCKPSSRKQIQSWARFIHRQNILFAVENKKLISSIFHKK